MLKFFTDGETFEVRSMKTAPVPVSEPFEINLHATLRKGTPFISGTQNCGLREFATILALWLILSAKTWNADPVEFSERLTRAVLEISAKKALFPER